MASHRFSIDCKEEEARFRGLLRFESRERVMAIRAEGESGKSHFVERIARLCRDAKPSVPAAVVNFAEFREGEGLGLLRGIRGAFGRSVDFARFDELVSNLDMRIWNPVIGSVDLRQARFENATDVDINGVRIDNPTGPVSVMAGGPIQLTDEPAIQAAQIECQRAFFAALAAHCEHGPAVVVLDTYEQGLGAVRDWFEREVRDRFMGDAWPQSLLLVIAGRTIPAFEDWPQRHYEDRIVRLDGLSRWKPEDIAEGFRDLGFIDLPDLFADIVKFLNLGATPGQLVGLMQLAGSPAVEGGS
jgi:hypothetical protein